MYVLVFFFVVLPSLACGYLYRYLTSEEWPRLRQALYFPIAGQSRWEHRTQRLRLLQRLGGVEVTVRTADDRDVHCVWIQRPRTASRVEPEDEDPVTTPVVLCLHANAMVLDDMIDWAQFYLVRGVSVMLVTFWGYPDPDEPDDEPMQAPGADSSLLGGPALRCPSEQTMYHDAEAALRYINETRRVPLDRTLVHGLSIGGGCAAALGAQHSGLRVTLDQTFASLWEVTMHVGTGLYDQLLLPRTPRRCHLLIKCLRPCALRLVAFVLLRMLFKTPWRAKGCLPYDRMDNLAKVGSIKGDVFTIQAEHDEMMEPSISPRLLASRYGRDASPDLLRSRSICVPGGHCCFFGDVPELAHKYTNYLTSCGFLPPDLPPT